MQNEKLIQQGCNYKLNCTIRNESYIGESGRPLHQRMKEHNMSTIMGDGLSAVSDHYSKSHPIIPEIPFTTTIIEKGSGFVDRKIKEGIAIRQHRPTINRDSGWASISTKYRQ